MENTEKIALPSILLILLWAYTGFDKILRWETSRKAFHNQNFPAELGMDEKNLLIHRISDPSGNFNNSRSVVSPQS